MDRTTGLKTHFQIPYAAISVHNIVRFCKVILKVICSKLGYSYGGKGGNPPPPPAMNQICDNHDSTKQIDVTLQKSNVQGHNSHFFPSYSLVNQPIF